MKPNKTLCAPSTTFACAALILCAANLLSCGGGAFCVPGAQVSCSCPSGTTGAQACNDSGSGYEECQGCDGSGGSGGSGGGTGGSGGGTGNSTPTLVADWVYKLQTGDDEINMTSTSSGTAQLYWYDSGEAQWQVSATDNGAGSASLTLSCTSSDCASATDIVFNCTYSLIALKCVGVSGGQMNNYKNYPLNLTKQN